MGREFRLKDPLSRPQPGAAGRGLFGGFWLGPGCLSRWLGNQSAGDRLRPKGESMGSEQTDLTDGGDGPVSLGQAAKETSILADEPAPQAEEGAPMEGPGDAAGVPDAEGDS
jgi:hypothetical protein